MSDQHNKFLKRLDASTPAVFRVAEWLHGFGRCVEIPALRKAPTASEAEGYFDSGDIIVTTRKRVEVKHLGVVFSGREDWPFKDALVSNKQAVDRSISEVSAYISVSRDMACIAIITSDTKDKWSVVERKAKNTGNTEIFYAAPLSVVEFRKLK